MNPVRRTTILALALCAPAVLAADLPVIDGQRAVASVNGEGIALADLEREIATMHMGREGGMKVKRQDPSALLERMINAKLLAQEARRTGLDELPEAKAAFENLRAGTLRDLLMERNAAKVAAPDPALVDRIYKDQVREYRVRSIFIPHEPDAKALHEKLGKGGNFDKLADELVRAKKAQEGDSRQFLKAGELIPDAVAEMAKLKPGQNSKVIAVGAGFAAFKLLEVRYPENAEARAMAQGAALAEKRAQASKSFVEGLRKKYAVVDQKLLAALDYEAPNALDKLANDARLLVQVKGDRPITVGELTAGMRQRYFHGLEQAVKAKRVNKEKASVLDDVVNRRVVPVEARAQKLDQTPEFKSRVARQEEGMLFGAFVQKAIVPGIKVEESDLKAYLAAHQSEYMSPEMMQLEALAFTQRKDAEDALAKLQRGADFGWLKRTLARQADPKTQKLLAFPEGLVVATTLPDGVRKALAGARDGDARFFGEAAGPFYVIHLRDVVPAKPAKLDDVREPVRKLVFDEKVTAAVADWAGKLRKASDVKTYVTGEALMKVVMQDLASGA